MKKVFMLLWVLAPVALVAWHYGPGMAQLAGDRAGEHIRAARAACAEGDWELAALCYGQAAKALPEEKKSDRNRLELAEACNQIRAGRMVEGQEQLQELLAELEKDEPRDSDLVAGVRHELATASYYAAWLMRLEVAASGKGLLPDLERLLELDHKSVDGFAIANVEDLGLEISSLDTSGDQVQPVCQRRWLLDLEPGNDVATGTFEFPKAKDPSIALGYQRYDDADVVDAGAVVPLHTFVLAERTWLWLGGGLAALLALTVTAAAAYRYRRRSHQASGPVYRRPDHLTPFNLLVLLKRIHTNQALDLPAGEREDLAETIDDLQQRFFQAGGAPGDSSELTAVLDRWLARTANGRKPARRVA